MEFAIEFYVSALGRCPVREFLDALQQSDPDDFAVVLAALNKLRNQIYDRPPLSKAIGDGLFEMRHVGEVEHASAVLLHDRSSNRGRSRDSQQGTGYSTTRSTGRCGQDARVEEASRSMKKTNFDAYLEEQLKDPAFAERFRNAGAAWDVALQLTALRRKAGLSQQQLARKLKTTQQQISRLESPGYEGHSLSMLRRVAHVLQAEVRVSIEPLSLQKRNATKKARPTDKRRSRSEPVAQ
jgi:ribosome-binding protein aMBF1 (putative translation factor)